MRGLCRSGAGTRKPTGFACAEARAARDLRQGETMATHEHAVEKGPGLARGPALIIGTILAAFGLILFLESGDTSTSGFPDGTVTGTEFLGIETNGWTAWFTTAAGALLLFGAAQHLLAKTMSLLVGLALGACAIIAAVDGDVLGLAAANFWTEIGWGIAAVLLVLNVFAPRVERDRHEDRDRGRRGFLPGRRPEHRDGDAEAVPADRGGGRPCARGSRAGRRHRDQDGHRAPARRDPAAGRLGAAQRRGAFRFRASGQAEDESCARRPVSAPGVPTPAPIRAEPTRSACRCSADSPPAGPRRSPKPKPGSSGGNVGT